jgi:cytochrome c oxidase cbb3-type subunit IV
MFKQHIQGLVGIHTGYLIFSLLLFMAFFLGVIWWLFKADKNYFKDMEQKPFEN